MIEFSPKNQLLEALSQQLTEDEWQEGLKIYQEGKVKLLSLFENLVSAKVNAGPRGFNIHLKLHKTQHFIQWAECNCTRNRKSSEYCQHIAAVLLYMSERNPELVSETTKLRFSEAAKKIENTSYSERIISQISQNISDISENESMMQVCFEINAGDLKKWDLKIDEQAQLFKAISPEDKSQLKPELKKLKIIENKLIPAYYLYLNQNQELEQRKIVVWKSEAQKLPKKLIGFEKEVIRLNDGEKNLNKIYGFFADSKRIIIGNKFVKINKFGFAEISLKSCDWKESAHKSVFNDEDAETIISQNNTKNHSQEERYLSLELANLQFEREPELTDVQVDEIDGWFYLNPIYKVGKTDTAMGNLVKEHVLKHRSFAKQKDRWIRIPELVKEFNWSLDSKNKIKLNRVELLRFQQELYNIKTIENRSEVLKKIIDHSSFQYPTPPEALSNTKLNLRDYQTDGYKWLWWLYKSELHGLLADDMGLGKTHQAMALLCAIMAENKKNNKNSHFLVVCPTSIVDHWIDKVESFAKNLNIISYYGPKRISLSNQLSKFNTVITSYGTLLRDQSILKSLSWDALILDEVHYVKNNKTSTYRAVTSLNAKLRLGLSGTPIENRPEELRNLFDILIPGYLGPNKNSKTKEPEDKKHSRLRNLVNPLQLRRTKLEVLRDLPEKVEDIRHCLLSDEQSQLYREVIQTKGQELVAQIKDTKNTFSYFNLLTVLHILKQICNHPDLVKENGSWNGGESGKFELLKELIKEALQSEQKIVIYSQYLKMIEFIKEYLKEIRVNFVSLTGKSQQRGKIIEKFQSDPNIKVFVGSLMAGGIGIDLTAASVVIHYDRWWNSSKEDQATDRVHRIGQNNFVQVIKMVTRGTLEERIDSMIQKKSKLIDKFFSANENIVKKLKREELIKLLEI